MWDQNPHGKVKETDQDERLSEQKIISLRNWGKCVDTVFSTCQSVGQAADEGWAGAGSKRKKGQNGPLG